MTAYGWRSGYLKRRVHPGTARTGHKKTLAGELLISADDAAARYPQLTRQNARGGQGVSRCETGICNAAAQVVNDLGGNGTVPVDLHVHRPYQ